MLKIIFTYIIEGITFIFYAWLTFIFIKVLISVFKDLRDKIFYP